MAISSNCTSLDPNSSWFTTAFKTVPNCLFLSQNWSIVLASLTSFFFLPGFIGNLVVILVLIFKPRMRTLASNLFILDLGFANILTVLLCLPVALLNILFSPWIFGDAVCKMVNYLQSVLTFVKVYSLLAISIDRLVALQSTNQRAFSTLTRSKTGLFSLFIWVCALLLNLPYLFAYGVVVQDNDLPNCQEIYWGNAHLEQGYFVSVKLLLGFTLPFCCILVTNLFMAWKMRGAGQASPEVPQFIARARKKIRRRATILLAMLALSLFVCHLPLFVVTTMDKFDDKFENDEDGIWKGLVRFVELISMISSCVNPYVYAFWSRPFRIALMEWIRPRRQRNRVRFVFSAENVYELHELGGGRPLMGRRVGVPGNENRCQIQDGV